MLQYQMRFWPNNIMNCCLFCIDYVYVLCREQTYGETVDRYEKRISSLKNEIRRLQQDNETSGKILTRSKNLYFVLSDYQLLLLNLDLPK